MKKSLLILLLLPLLSVFDGYALNPQYKKFLNLNYRSPSFNFSPGEFQSITGRFDGKTVDTLTLFPLDGDWEDGEFVYYQWVVISKNGTVPSSIVNSVRPELVYEGDLDRNGCDDWGVLITAIHGAWTTYNIYTCYKGKVENFASTTWWLGDEDPLTIIARQGARRGEVIIGECRWNKDLTEMLKPYKTVKIAKFLK